MSDTLVDTPALRPVHTPIHPNDRGNILLQFREQGFARIGDVFERDSVDPYLDQIRARVRQTQQWWNPMEIAEDDTLSHAPANAPRVLDVLRGAFMPWIDEPQPVLMKCGWLVKPDNPDAKLVHDWHKDADHPCTTCIQGYTYPAVIHTATYFTDMTPEHGPTYVIPRSHRDPTRSPYAGAAEAPFLPMKGDVIIWDQRLWHRASPRTVPGLRLLHMCAYFPVPYAPKQPERSPAHRTLRDRAESNTDRVLYGGFHAD